MQLNSCPSLAYLSKHARTPKTQWSTFMNHHNGHRPRAAGHTIAHTSHGTRIRVTNASHGTIRRGGVGWGAGGRIYPDPDRCRQSRINRRKGEPKEERWPPR
eukprot:scaffold8117_cov103-Isochrysis_galbana.AAC.2